jgi:hypothetical protein
MATEAARLKRENLLIGKRKTDLTLTGLLMEGLGSVAVSESKHSPVRLVRIGAFE